jgi:hypothetical protein
VTKEVKLHTKGGLREGAEELNGFLGNNHTLRKTIKNNGGVYKISHNDYHTYAF